MICNCKQVSYSDIADAIHKMDDLSDVVAIFEDVKLITHCSTGCGTCHDRVMDVISEIVMGSSRV